MSKNDVRFLVAASVCNIVLETEEEVRIAVLQPVLRNNMNRVFDADFLFGDIDLE